MKTKQEFSAGGVVYKKDQSGIVFLLGKHSGYHKWVLPKGLIEKGEKPKQTAIRETQEEMGVTAKIVKSKPIHTETYRYMADLKHSLDLQSKALESTRRVKTYQEQGGGQTKVEKTVQFFLMEYVSGDPSQHGWEMENAGWFSYEQALEIMGFEGEKAGLKKAWELLKS
ncbi:NUDIX domain-containing protein [Candidatus Beckwithbacteria bacterium]|nr:NUDIX domain-containing protein [Candidatus Beckwithbacteria bacterium]